MSDDPRDDIVDPIAKLVHDVDQYQASVNHLAAAMAADHIALVRHGMSSEAAAVLVGQRWRVT